MYARSDMPISFPGLFGEWEFNPSPVAIDIGNGVHIRTAGKKQLSYLFIGGQSL